MTQKQMLMHALAFAESPCLGDAAAKKAARAFCVISWLHDLNWHPEADALKTKVRSMTQMAHAFATLETDSVRTSTLHNIGSFLNHLYEWGLTRNEWRATEGAALVEELWQIINSQNEHAVKTYHPARE